MLPELMILLSLCLSVDLLTNRDQRVLLKDVRELTLYKGLQTKGRRVASIPQLNCVGGSAKCAYMPERMNCYNKGSDGIDIQWMCRSELPKEYKLGKLNVLCEGYDSSEDPYILGGSCGVEYYLEWDDSNSHDLNFRFTDVFVLILLMFFFVVLVILLVKGRTTVSNTESEHRQCRKCREFVYQYQYKSDTYISMIRESRLEARNLCKECILHTYPDLERPINIFCRYPRFACTCAHSQTSDDGYNLIDEIFNRSTRKGYGGTRRR